MVERKRLGKPDTERAARSRGVTLEAKLDSYSDDADELASYRLYLTIDRDDLDSCLIEQPSLYYRVSIAYALAVADRDAAKLELEEATAELDQILRAKAAREETRVTEDQIKQQLRSLPRIADLNKAFLKRRASAEMWAAMKEAFQQRSYMLKELVSLYVGQRYDQALEAGAGQARTDLADLNRRRAGQMRRLQRVAKE